MTYIGETSYLFGANAPYIADLYEQYLKDKTSLSDEWKLFFEDMDGFDLSILRDLKGGRDTRVVGVKNKHAPSDYLSFDAKEGDVIGTLSEVLQHIQSGAGLNNLDSRQAALDTARAMLFIRAYRLFGHFGADLDPLGIVKQENTEELLPESYGFNPVTDMDRPIFLNYALGLEMATLREIIQRCEEIYCGTFGAEYLHMSTKIEKDWMKENIESGVFKETLTKQGKETVLERLAHTDLFEQFLDKKHRGTKRFGLDGGESLVPLIEQVIMRCGDKGLENVVMGMAHRGRLNILCNILRKPYSAMFNEFMGGSATPDDLEVSGDVKYHLGAGAERHFNNCTVSLSLVPNPSHLEAVNTVVLGKVHAKQVSANDLEGDKSMGILLHGDAAFIGQGIVAETLLLSQLEGYKTGGTIHIAINNQIGFTTKPSKSRSSRYCSDMAKMIDAPVFHVNGDDVEACIFIARLAADYRMRFKKDVVIDMWCYRRHGHNEGDEPMFTQPKMYTKVAEQERIIDIYSKKLIDEGTLKQEEVDAVIKSVNQELENAYEVAKDYKPNKADWLEGVWEGLSVAPSKDEIRRGETHIAEHKFDEVARGLVKKPDNFVLNSKILKRIDVINKSYTQGTGIDWASGEALAFGSLLLESTPIRLSGEDCQRGTFSQRHSVWIDQENENEHTPLNSIRPGQAPFKVLDSPLSEFGLLGFEYGYAMEQPQALVLWEAQFGDFANGAQVIIDQFIASGETKWLRMNGLVMLLPHGYEGQGPEHSSARLERYLQLSAEDNWQVCNVTTPANYFHLLRRQVKRNFRKPLILLTPKSLLRNKACVSQKEDFLEGSHFHRYYMDEQEKLGTAIARKDVKRVVICSGKVYYDLLEMRTQHAIKDIHIVRLEQLYPFPKNGLASEFKDYKNAQFIWCQEEPENNGGWNYVDRKLEESLTLAKVKNTRPVYVGRKPASSPATGSMRTHITQQELLVKRALDITSKV